MSCWDVSPDTGFVVFGSAGNSWRNFVLTVLSLMSSGSSTGVTWPPRNRFCPAAEYRYSSQRRAAAGSGAL